MYRIWGFKNRGAVTYPYEANVSGSETVSATAYLMVAGFFGTLPEDDRGQNRRWLHLSAGKSSYLATIRSMQLC